MSFDVSEHESLRVELRRRADLRELLRDATKPKMWTHVLAGAATLQGDSPWWVIPDDRETVRAAWATAAAHDAEFRVQHRSLHGNTRPYYCRPEEGLGGRIEAWLGVVGPPPRAERQAEKSAVAPWSVRAARAALGWSSTELAQRASVSFSTVRRAEGAIDGAVQRLPLGLSWLPSGLPHSLLHG